MTEREQNLRDVQRADNWPQWPFLPMKRVRKNGTREFGALINATLEGPHTDSTIYFGNIFEGIDPATAPTIVYETFDAMLDDGWEVD